MRPVIFILFYFFYNLHILFFAHFLALEEENLEKKHSNIAEQKAATSMKNVEEEENDER